MLQRSFKRVRWKLWVKPWQNVDWFLLALPVSLTLLGGLAIRSAELNQGLTDWWQHWLTGGVGLVLTLAIARWRYENLMQLHWVIYGAVSFLLIAVMISGNTVSGAQRWISIAGFQFQPSEFAKVGLIITLAALLHTRTAATIPVIVKTLGVAVVPWALVFLQPDLGTSLVFGAITLGMLYWANASLGWIILLISPLVSAILFNLPLPFNLPLVLWVIWAVAMGIIGWLTIPLPLLGGLAGIGVNLVAGGLGHLLWGLLKDYQKDRLILFLDPDKDPLGGGYHLIQSRIAIGAGELWGRGLNHGTQTRLNFIPEQHTDFIFSAIAEELGFAGALLVILAFWLICLRLILIAQGANDNFGSLLAMGVFSMLLFQVVVNLGMTIGLAPVVGIPLPWISYGRSAMLTNFIAIGLVESVANHRQRRKY
jgi:rod shape determining protein RodA